MSASVKPDLGLCYRIRLKLLLARDAQVFAPPYATLATNKP